VLDNESGPLGRHDELLDDFTSVNTLFGIEVCGRFIDEQNIGWNTEHETDGDSLQLSSRQSEGLACYCIKGLGLTSGHPGQ